MTVSTTTAPETKQAFGYKELFSAGGAGGEDPTLDELIVMLDGIDDPFVQTVFILHILMPAMVKTKEDNLDELATSLETMADYTTDLASIQQSFNELQDPESDFAGLAESIMTGIDTLLAKIETAESPLDEGLEAQIVTALTGMQELVQSGGSTYAEQGKTINRLWNPEIYWESIDEVPPNPYQPKVWYVASYLPPEMADKDLNPYYKDMNPMYIHDSNGEKVLCLQVPDNVWEWYHTYSSYEDMHSGIMEDDQLMKGYLDDFNVTGTSLKSQSALTQALVEHDGSEYNAFIALNKDMFKEFHNQIQAHGRALRNL